MKLKWESNSRTKHLADMGRIDHEDVISRTTTNEFPVDAATVRMRQLSEKVPHVTIHIRGKATSKSMWNGRTYECAPTCRINLGGSWQGKPNTAMDSN